MSDDEGIGEAICHNCEIEVIDLDECKCNNEPYCCKNCIIYSCDIKDTNKYCQVCIPTRDYYERLIKELNECKCCERHQINKPTQLENWLEIEKEQFAQYYDCDCDCRHRARWICRNYFN